MANVLAAGLMVPVAWAIDFMLSHEIMPDSVLFGPTTTCQSRGGQAPWAVEWNAKSRPSGTCADATPRLAVSASAPTVRPLAICMW